MDVYNRQKVSVVNAVAQQFDADLKSILFNAPPSNPMRKISLNNLLVLFILIFQH